MRKKEKYGISWFKYIKTKIELAFITFKEEIFNKPIEQRKCETLANCKYTSYADLFDYDVLRNFDVSRVDPLYRTYFEGIKNDPIGNFLKKGMFAGYEGPVCTKYFNFFKEMGFNLELLLPKSSEHMKKEMRYAALEQTYYQGLRTERTHKKIRTISIMIYIPILMTLTGILIATFL